MTIALYTASLLGFGGGEDSLSSLRAAHVDGGRRFLSAYNAPGSYTAGRRFVALCESHGWDGLHQGISANPDALTSSSTVATCPKFTAAFSGASLSTTGPISRVLLEHSRSKAIHVVEGRVTTPVAITIVSLDAAPGSEEHPRIKLSAPVAVPFLASAAAAAGCGLVGDWTSFSMIVLGMACNGVSSYFLQAGDLTFTRPNCTEGAPAGDGYLEAGNEIVVLKGSEEAVSAVTRGQFSLRYKREGTYNALRVCGSLLTVQCFVQLILVPLGTVLGQSLFLVSMVVAWMYNAYVARQEKAAWRRMVLEDLLKAPSMKRYSLGTRTATAVFLMLVLRPANMEEQLANLLPNDTPVWKTWRKTVAHRLHAGKPNFLEGAVDDGAGLEPSERTLLQTLYRDAQDAVDAHASWNGKF